jgi:hypothetical protein
MWKLLSGASPPIGEVVNTKVHDEYGVRNERPLKWDGRLWWEADGNMYVHYKPTHWK